MYCEHYYIWVCVGYRVYCEYRGIHRMIWVYRGIHRMIWVYRGIGAFIGGFGCIGSTGAYSG